MCFKSSNVGLCISDDRRPKNGRFFKKVPEGGGGSFPVQKITLQILLVSKRYILEKKKRNVISEKGRGGGRGRLDFFQKKHPYLR